MGSDKVLRIGVDVDDVIADLLTAWLNRYNRENDTHWTPADLTQWELQKDLGCSGNAIHKHLTPDIYDEVLPHEGALEAVKAIEALAEVAFVTNCKDGATYVRKVRWLRDNGFKSESVYGCYEGSIFETKNDVPVDWLIDDHIGNLEKFTRGYPVLLTRPHNRNLVWPGKRIKHLKDVAAMLRYATALPTGETVIQADASKPIEWTQAFEVIKPAVRQFETGATRDVDDGKLDYEGFLSPIVLERFAQYMHKNRYQKDGTIRASDNWAKGIPVDAYMKSLARHFMALWLAHRRGEPLPEDEACAVIFNVQGLIFEHLKAKTP